jgi:hypothetical protein
MLKKILLSVILLSVAASASVTVNATLTDQQGNPQPFAFLEVQLVDCGANIPVSGNSSIVVKDMKFTPSQLPATIYGNNEITCGNSYSTLYHITAWANNNTKLAGDMNYDICSSTTNCLVTPDPTWNLAQSQPFSGTPPPPGYSSIFGNPVLSQVLTQPAGTALNLNGLVNLNGSPVCTPANNLCGGGGGGGSVIGTPGQINVSAGNVVSLSSPITTAFNVTGPATMTSIDGVCFVDGVTYTTINAAIAGCGSLGAVIIPSGYLGADSITNPGNIPLLDFRGGGATSELRIWSAIAPAFPVTGYPEGADFVTRFRGPADLRAEDLPVRTSTTATLSVGVNTNILVGPVTVSNLVRGTLQTGTTSLLATAAGVGLFVGRNTANEEVVSTWSVVDPTHITITCAKSHSGTTDIEQIGAAYLTAYAFVVDSQSVHPNQDSTNSSPLRIYDNQLNYITLIPGRITDPFPYNAIGIATTITGISNSATPFAPGNVNFQDNTSSFGFQFKNSTGSVLETFNDTGLEIASSASFILYGSGSGGTTLAAPATGGGIATFPTGSGTLCYTTTCAGTVTGVVSGGGLQLSGTNLELLPSCTSNQVLQWNGSAWVCASISGTVSGQVKGQPTAGTGSTTITSSPGTLYVSAFCGGTTTCPSVTDESFAIQAAVTQLKNGGSSGATGHIVDDMCGTQTWSEQPFTGFAGLFETQANCSIANTHIISVDGTSTLMLPTSMQWRGTGGNGFAQVPSNTWVQACNPIIQTCINGGFSVQQCGIASTTYTASSSQLTITCSSGAPFTTCAANGVCSSNTTGTLTAVNSVQQYRLLCINNSSQPTNNGCWTYKTTAAFGAPQSFVVNVPGSGLVSCGSTCGTLYLETPLVSIGNGGGGGVYHTRIDNVVLVGSYLPGVGGAVNGQGEEGTGIFEIQAFDTPAYYIRLDQSAAFGGQSGGDTNSLGGGDWAGNMTPLVCSKTTCACAGLPGGSSGGHGSCSSTTLGVPGTVNQGDWIACGSGSSFATISPDPCTNPNFVGFLVTGASQNQGPGRIVGHMTASIADKSAGGGTPIKQLQGSGTITGTQTATTASGFMCIGSHCTFDDTHAEYFSTAYEIGGNVARNATWQLAYSVATAGGSLVPVTAGVIFDGGFTSFQGGGTGFDIGQSGGGAFVQDVSIRGVNVGLGSGNALEDNISGNSCSDATISYFLGHGTNPIVISTCSTTTGVTSPSIADAALPINSDIYAAAGGLLTGVTAPTTPAGVPQVPCSIPVGGSSAPPVNCLPGIAPRVVSGTTDTLGNGTGTGAAPGGSTDCNPLRIVYNGSSAVAIALPTATALGVPNCTMKLVNNLSSVADLTITPNSWTCNGASTCTLHNGQEAVLFVDAAGGAWDMDVTEQALSAGSGVTFTRSASGLSIASSLSGAANAALSNLSGVAINAALLPGSDNSIALGSNSFHWTTLFSTALNCGIVGTTSCVITGSGSTSGTATMTWPAVAATAANPFVFSNGLNLPNGASTTPTLTFANNNTTGFWSQASSVVCFSASGASSPGTCFQGASGGFQLTPSWTLGWGQASASGTLGANFSLVGTSTNEIINPSTVLLLPQCKIIAAVNMTVSGTHYTFCSWNLPNSAQTWAWQCSGTYTTSTASDTFALGYTASQAPTGATGNAIIYSTLTGTSTAGSVTSTTSTANQTILTGATVSSVTSEPFTTSGVIQASATAGTFVLTGTLTGTSPSGSVNPGTTCQIY